MTIKFAKSLLVTLCLLAMVVQANSNQPAVIPRPEKMELLDGKYTVGPKTAIVVEPKTRAVGEYLTKLLRVPTGFDLEIRNASPSSELENNIILRIVPGKEHLGSEGYILKVLKDRVFIEATTETGVFYGVQTLRQLLPAAVESEWPTVGVDWDVPCVKIADKPRYSWRGLMLDPGHNFLDKDHLNRYINTMALYKMNRLHLHLTDFNWAIEIKKYPELTDLKNRTPITNRWRRTYGKCTYGFYTQNEMREVIAYAAARHVTIIPEIEVPAHATCALTCYPELSCPNWRFKVEPAERCYWDYRTNYCAGNDKAFEFLENVLSEIIEIFPSPIIHIGGDERRGGNWRRCPLCQARIKAEGLKDEDELQSYFIDRIEKFLASRGKRIIGWSEIVDGGLTPGATVQSWLGPKYAVHAANKGHDVVMSTNRFCYLDYQSLPLKKCYSFEPTPPGLKPGMEKHIIGLETCLWGYPQHRHDELLFPRLCAIAEVGWSPKDARNWDDFQTRIKSHDRRLDEIGINCSRRKPSIWEK